MPNLTSTLTIRLTDLLTKPAKTAAGSLKELGLSAKQLDSLKAAGVSARDLDKALKLDNLKTARVSMRAAATDFQKAQETVRRLAQEFAASTAPTKQMEQALERARAEASATGRTFERQSSAFRQARMAAQELGIPLSRVVAEEERLRRSAQAATQAIERQAQAEQRLGARVRRGIGTVAGNVAPFLGPPILHGTKEAVKSGAEIESEKVKLRAAGIPEKEIGAATAQAFKLQAQYPTLKVSEILERFREARSVLLHPSEAMTELPVVAQTNAALKALESIGRVPHGSGEGLGFALKGAEVLGVAQHPERLRAYLDSFVKARQVMGDLITSEQIYDFATNVKSSGALLSDRFLHTTAMSLTGELRGMRAGVGVDQFVKQITGGFQGSQHAAAKEFLALGLLGKGDFEKTKTGSIKGLKPGRHVAGWQLAQTDPDQWVQQYLIPAMRMKGYTDPQQQLALVRRLFTSSRAADIVSKLITQSESFMNHAAQMHAATGLLATELIKTDPVASLNALTTSIGNFAGTLTGPVMTSAAGGMSWLSRSISEWSESLSRYQKEHPTAGKIAGAAAIGVGGYYGVKWTYRLFEGLTSGFGLKTSAAALEVAAAHLDVAALKLGATGGAPAAAVNKVTKGAAAAAVPGALTVAGIKKGGPVAAAITGLEVMKKDAETGNHVRSWLRSLFGLPDAHEPAPWMPGGSWDKERHATDRPSAERINLDAIQRRIAGAPHPAAPRLAAELANASPRIETAAASRQASEIAAPPSPAAPRPAFTINPAPRLPSVAWTAGPTDLWHSPHDGQRRFGRIDRTEPPPPYTGVDTSSVDRLAASLSDQTGAAGSAGHAMGQSFREALLDELRKAEGDVGTVMRRIIDHLTFSASPEVRAPAAAPQGGASPGVGNSGGMQRGLFADYGIAP